MVKKIEETNPRAREDKLIRLDNDVYNKLIRAKKFYAFESLNSTVEFLVIKDKRMRSGLKK